MIMFSSRFSALECVKAAAFLLCIYASLSPAQALEDQCEVNFNGKSQYVGLSELKNVFNKDAFSHTFEFLFNPRQGSTGEQSLLQTGIVKHTGGSWAVEIKFKATIWLQKELFPSSSVIYIDEWAKEDGWAQWQKTRHYIVLGLESFPWLHISFTRGGEIAINGKQRRLDRYNTAAVEAQPRGTFALGESFSGSLDEVRIWRGQKSTGAEILSTLCVEDAKPTLALYLPFNECKGNVFTGYTQDGPICALMRGSSQDPIWTRTSPVVSRACTLMPQYESYCADAERKDAEHTSTPVESSEVFVNPTYTFRLVDFKSGGLLLVVVILALVGFSRVRRAQPPPVAAV